MHHSAEVPLCVLMLCYLQSADLSISSSVLQMYFLFQTVELCCINVKMSSAGSALLISSSHELRNDNHFSHRSHLRHTLLPGIRHTLSDEISKVTGYPSSGDVRSSVPVVHEKNIAVNSFLSNSFES